MAKEDERVLTLIKRGGAIGGAATGSVVGFLAGGPIGAAVGGALGATLQTVATEIVNRELSRREEVRVGATTSYAIDFIHERLERSDRPREDKFFVREQSGSSPAQVTTTSRVRPATTSSTARTATTRSTAARAPTSAIRGRARAA